MPFVFESKLKGPELSRVTELCASAARWRHGLDQWVIDRERQLTALIFEPYGNHVMGFQHGDLYFFEKDGLFHEASYSRSLKTINGSTFCFVKVECPTLNFEMWHQIVFDAAYAYERHRPQPLGTTLIVVPGHFWLKHEFHLLDEASFFNNLPAKIIAIKKTKPPKRIPFVRRRKPISFAETFLCTVFRTLRAVALIYLVLSFPIVIETLVYLISLEMPSREILNKYLRFHFYPALYCEAARFIVNRIRVPYGHLPLKWWMP